MKTILYCAISLLTLISSTVFALPSSVSPGEKVIIVDPREHMWGAYSASGNLIRTGIAASGSDWCKDEQRECHTRTGEFRIRSLGGPSCTSPSFPLPTGGAPMPYCMYFNEAQALHGSPHMARGNISHGCVRMYPRDARWMRYNFAQIGTKVIILSY